MWEDMGHLRGGYGRVHVGPLSQVIHSDTDLPWEVRAACGMVQTAYGSITTRLDLRR